MTIDFLTEIENLRKRVQGPRPLGFPAGMAFPSLEPIADILNHYLNNAGDPRAETPWPWHTRDLEQLVIDFHAKLFQAPSKYWGYIAANASEATLNALYIARAQLGRNALVYYWKSAHPSVSAAIDKLGLDPIQLRVRKPCDASDPMDLARQLDFHRDRPAIVVATVGTTMTEWIDDVRGIVNVLRESLVPYYVHVDGALSAVPLALLPEDVRPAFDFAQGVHSIGVSGHKFYGVIDPCAALIVRGPLPSSLTQVISYISADQIMAYESRSGRTSLLWAWALHNWSVDELRERANEARAVAAYALEELKKISIHWFRNLPGFTVAYPGPLHPAIVRRHALAASEGVTHFVCMPGVTRPMIDELVRDLVLTASGEARS